MNAEKTTNTEHSNPDNWYCIFYYAPKDPNVIVAKRRGWEYGSTLNFARLQSYLILSIPLVMGAAIATCAALFGR